MTIALGAVVAQDTATSFRVIPTTAEAVAPTPDAASRAAALVATKVTRKPVHIVEAILVAHDNGELLNRIAADVGVHHSAVRRVLDADRAQDRAERSVAL